MTKKGHQKFLWEIAGKKVIFRKFAW